MGSAVYQGLWGVWSMGSVVYQGLWGVWSVGSVVSGECGQQLTLFGDGRVSNGKLHEHGLRGFPHFPLPLKLVGLGPPMLLRLSAAVTLTA